MQSKVSIVVPIYGVEKYIERCARSLFEQTFDDIEYIFVNDCTKDNSIAILKSVIIEYPNKKVTIINKEQNEGLPQARKTGVEIATGTYILHIDSDDWVELDLVERLYNKAVETNADMVYCDWVEEYSDHKEEYHQKTMSIDEYRDSILMFESYAYTWNRLCKRSLYKDIIFPTNNMLEDFVITTQLIFNCNSIVLVPAFLCHYSKQNSSSIMSDRIRKIMKEKVENIFLIFCILKKKEYFVNKKYIADNMLIYMLWTSFSYKVSSIVKSSVLDEIVVEYKKVKLYRNSKWGILKQLILKFVFGSCLYKIIS